MKLVKPQPDRAVPRGVVGGSEVSAATAGASGIYMGLFRLEPGARSRPHYHAQCESACFMLSGEMVVSCGDGQEGALSRDSSRPLSAASMATSDSSAPPASSVMDMAQAQSSPARRCMYSIARARLV